MCCIIVKPTGVNMPSLDILRACAIANPHGFGVCTPTRYFRTLDAEEFIAELMNVDKSEPAIIHFRYMTTGSICEENCHPFYDEETGTAFVHNGVLPFHPRADITDSEFAFRTFIVPSIKAHGYGSKGVAASVNRIIGSSKFAMLKGNRLCMFGHFEKVDGVYYSNLRFWSYMRRSMFESSYYDHLFKVVV